MRLTLAQVPSNARWQQRWPTPIARRAERRQPSLTGLRLSWTARPARKAGACGRGPLHPKRQHRLLRQRGGQDARQEAERRVQQEFGFAARLIVVEAARWGEIVAANPYARQAAKDPKTVDAALCEGLPQADALAALLAKTGGRESFNVAGDVIYLHAPMASALRSLQLAWSARPACR